MQHHVVPFASKTGKTVVCHGETVAGVVDRSSIAICTRDCPATWLKLPIAMSLVPSGETSISGTPSVPGAGS